jgi:hypothetical protein
MLHLQQGVRPNDPYLTSCPQARIELPPRPPELRLAEIIDDESEPYLMQCLELPHKLVEHVPRRLRAKWGELMTIAVSAAQSQNSVGAWCRLMALP